MVDSEPVPSWATVCQNCGEALSGPFCARCGQRAAPPHPTTRELAGDAWQELLGWDGKVVQTLRLLIRRAGALTVAAIEGRRRRHLSAVRLYLICSLVFFLVESRVPLPDEDIRFEFGVGFGAPADATPADALSLAITRGWEALTPAEGADAERQIADMNPVVQPIVRGLVTDYQGFMTRFLGVLPRLLFVLVPALAGVLAIFYRGRHFPEHLYCALHFGAFAFAMLTLSSLAEYAQWPPLSVAGSIVAAVAIVSYGFLAQRRVYGGSRLATGAKAIGIAALYGALWSTVAFGVALWVART